jgi:glycine/D-amino acid oxidase-like deaminating enzyme
MDLHSYQPFWLLRNGLIEDRRSLIGQTRCDVLVVGAGITGALVADRLNRAGADVIVVDRRRAAAGSTSASTALLIYDIDEPLHRLIDIVGEAHAVRAYRMGIEAIDDLEALTADWTDVDFVRRQSLLVAQPDQAEQVDKEYEARKAHGFDVERLDGEALLGEYGIHRPNGMRAQVAAEVDPYRLTHRLLERVTHNGGRVFDRVDIDRTDYDGSHVTAHLKEGGTITAKRVVYATGYEGANVVGQDYVKLLSTFALATEPFAPTGYWSGNPIVWETGEPYLYFRTTSNGRVIVGGEDVPFQNAEARDALLPSKIDTILKKMQQMIPDLRLKPEFTWAGTFGHTGDGLPYIGEHEDHPGCLFALGYGGNGITFSTIATWIIAELCQGRQHPDQALYRFDRPTAGK